MELNKNKAASGNGNIPIKSLETNASDMFVPLTDYINSTILNGVFHYELKLAKCDTP